MSSVSVPWWAAIFVTLLGPLISFTGGTLAARLQRRTGAETVAAMRETTQVTRATSRATTRSSEAAERAAHTAEQAAREVSKFRLHDDTMRTLYWAADHAIAVESHRALLGLEVLAALVDQAQEDMNARARRIVSATGAAVLKVAVPTFLAVLTNAASGGAGRIRVSAVEINAARLLLEHAIDLGPELQNEIELVASAVPGTEVEVEHLHTGRHLEQELSLEKELAVEQDYGLEL